MSFRQFFSSKLRTEHNDFVGKNGSITYFNGNLYYHDGRTPGGLRIDQDTGVGGEALATEDYVDNRIEQVIDLAPAALDTLKELAQALGNNADFATSITNLLADKASILYVDTEITNLTSSVNASLATKASITYVDSEINELHDAVNSSINLLQAAIDAEVIDRANGDNTLQNNINAEANAREDADTILQNNINAEALARGTADNNLQANINTLSTQLSSETQARQNADNSLTSLINAETTARLQADGNLTADIADEANARSSADAALLTAINLESTARESLRTSLEGQITAERNDRIDDVNDLQANLQTEIVNRINAVNAEATIRANADNGLQTAITNEANARVQGDQDLQSIIDAVESSYIAADANLTARITQEIVDRTAAVSAEATARTSADTNLQNQIDFIKENIDPAALDSLKEIVAAFQGEDLNIANSIATINTTLVTLQGANATETAARQAADTTLQNNINAEATTRANADASLQSQIDNIISNIDPAQLDSLSEIVTAFQTADGSLTNTINNLQTTLQGNINDVASDLATETTNRTNADLSLQQNINTEASDRAAADQTLQNNIDAEATARVNAVNGLQSSLNTEITNRQSADTILQNNITAEATARQTSDQSILDSLNQEILDRQTAVSDEALARQSADSTLQNNIDAEATARTNADNTLQSNIDAEALARQNADTTLQNNITAEATARQGADNTLQGNIDAEESARITADSTLQTNISNEAIARQTGDTNLQNQIDDIRSNLDPAALDSLTEIVAAFQSGDLDIANNIATINSTLIDLQSADTTLQNNIDTEANARQTDILNEALARESADTNLQNQIDDIKSNLDPAALDSLTEIVAAFQTADGSLANTVTNLQTTLSGDIIAEATARENADTNLQNQINDIKSNLDPAALDSLTEIVAAFQSGDLDIANNIATINSTLVDLQSADTTLQSNIDAEVLARQGDVTTLQGNINDEITARSSADTNLQNQINDIKSNLDPAALDSLTEIVAAFQSGDLDIANNIATINTTLATKFNTADFTSTADTWLGTKSTSDVAEGSNLYYTDERARLAVGAVDTGGDGSFSYDNTTGTFTYTGPSATEVRAHLSAGTGVLYDNTTGAISADTATMATKAYVDSEISNISTFSISNGNSIASIPTASGDFNVSLNDGGKEWNFNATNGELRVPGPVNFFQNVDIPLGAPVAGGGTDRVRLWDFNGGGSNFNYAIGAEGNHVWFAMDVNNGTGGFKFYSRDNQVFKIRDDGALMFADATTQTTAYPGTSILNGYATETYVNNAVAAVVDSAPEVLNTLNELAAALGDNPDFVTTITGQIGLKANSADVYLKTETYTQTEINNALGLKANLADVYTSLQVDSALALKANSADVYLKTETYTQSEINNALGLKADTSSLAAVATSGDYDDLSNRIPYSTLGALTNRTIQVGAGTLSYTPTIETGLVAAGNHTGTYAGLTVQNNNAGATSSANIYFSNTGANETADFAVIGLNGPNYNFGYDTVDGAKKLLYIANTDGDIVLIPNLFGAGNTHFGYAGGSAAISVTNGGGLSLGTTWNNAGQTYVLNEGTAGQILTSGGTGQPVTWSTPAPQNQLVAGATSLTLDSSGKITLPQGSVINESGSVSCATGIATAIYTATSSNMTTIKLLVQVEEFAGTTQIQSSEIMAIKAFGTNTVASSIYGTVYSSAGPLATFTAELDGSNNIVIKCQPTGANTLTARVVATEIVTSD